MAATSAMSVLGLSRACIEANRGIIDPARHFADQIGMMRQAYAELDTVVTSQLCKALATRTEHHD